MPGRQRTLLLFCLLLVGLHTTSLGQKKLLFHKNRHRDMLYKVGDFLSFRLRGNPSRITQQIKGFDNDQIFFQDFAISPKEITHLYVDDKTKTWYIFRYKYQYLLPIMGAGYILLDVANNGDLNKETLTIGGSFIVAGLLAKLLISDAMKIRGQRKIVIMR